MLVKFAMAKSIFEVNEPLEDGKLVSLIRDSNHDQPVIYYLYLAWYDA